MTNRIHNITLSALFLALGIIFPMVFHSVPNGGSIFLPMHIPVLLCGFICGPAFGVLVGVLTPLLSSLLTGMPPLMPIGISMMLELMTYGFFTGLLLKRMNIFASLLIAMLLGRTVSGLANLILLSFMGKAYSISIFLSAAFITALPGILMQIASVPLLVHVMQKLLVKTSES